MTVLQSRFHVIRKKSLCIEKPWLALKKSSFDSFEETPLPALQTLPLRSLVIRKKGTRESELDPLFPLWLWRTDSDGRCRPPSPLPGDFEETAFVGFTDASSSLFDGSNS